MGVMELCYGIIGLSRIFQLLNFLFGKGAKEVAVEKDPYKWYKNGQKDTQRSTKYAKIS